MAKLMRLISLLQGKSENIELVFQSQKNQYVNPSYQSMLLETLEMLKTAVTSQYPKIVIRLCVDTLLLKPTFDIDKKWVEAYTQFHLKQETAFLNTDLETSTSERVGTDDKKNLEFVFKLNRETLEQEIALQNSVLTPAQIAPKVIQAKSFAHLCKEYNQSPYNSYALRAPNLSQQHVTLGGFLGKRELLKSAGYSTLITPELSETLISSKQGRSRRKTCKNSEIELSEKSNFSLKTTNAPSSVQNTPETETSADNKNYEGMRQAVSDIYSREIEELLQQSAEKLQIDDDLFGGVVFDNQSYYFDTQSHFSAFEEGI